jgi:hypothetical protein
MPTYKRKSETIEAVQFTAEHAAQLAIGGVKLPAPLTCVRASELGGITLDGEPIAFGDYVIALSKGRAKVVKRAEFEAAYELAASAPEPDAATESATPATGPGVREMARALIAEHQAKEAPEFTTPVVMAPERGAVPIPGVPEGAGVNAPSPAPTGEGIGSQSGRHRERGLGGQGSGSRTRGGK